MIEMLLLISIMPSFIDLTKKRFGRLTVIERAENAKCGNIRWRCICDCGNETIPQSVSLRNGTTQSCGCLQKEIVIKLKTTHGMSNSTTYVCWSHMLNRCNDCNSREYKNYGGRGITVCDSWLKFENFLTDMGEKQTGLTIERKNNNLGYCKENCEWATHTKQNRNQRIKKNNKTGTSGVFWSEKKQKYIVRIRVNYKQIYLGSFNELNNARDARKVGELKYW